MELSRRTFVKGALGAATLLATRGAAAGEQVVRYVRFEREGWWSYGTLEGERVREMRRTPWTSPEPTDASWPLDGVRLLCPCEPSKIIAMAGNYRSHLQDAPVPDHPEAFFKVPSALLDPGGTIVIPEGTDDVHYEGELVLVMGRRARNVSRDEAARCVLGATCGNDVSARDWQRDDTQWWRAKSCDTFAPVGPSIARGLDCGSLRLVTRLNGEVKQDSNTSDLIFDVATIVSFLSRHLTLLPGDLIFTGTPGTTTAMKPGDRVEVEIEGIGTLRNRVG